MPCANNKLRRCAEIFCIETTELLLYRCSRCQDWFGAHNDCADHLKMGCSLTQKEEQNGTLEETAEATADIIADVEDNIKKIDVEASIETPKDNVDTIEDNLGIVEDNLENVEHHCEDIKLDIEKIEDVGQCYDSTDGSKILEMDISPCDDPLDSRQTELFEDEETLQESYLDYDDEEYLDRKSNIELHDEDLESCNDKNYNLMEPDITQSILHIDAVKIEPLHDQRGLYDPKKKPIDQPNVILVFKEESNHAQPENRDLYNQRSPHKNNKQETAKKRKSRNSVDPPSSFTTLLLDTLRTQNNPNLTCDICHKEFRTRYRLLVHMPSHYGPHLKCKRCPAAFSTYNEIRAHSKSHPRQLYFCEICGAKHTDRRNLETHVRTHTGEKPYKCDMCPRAFNDTYKLKIHRQRHTNDLPFKCELCPKRFVAAGIAAAHQKSHQGLKPFKCERCDKSFVTKQGLTMHMLAHNGERPLACTVCDKRFLWAHSLRKHMNLHDEKREFSCGECEKKCSSLAYLRLHQKRAHQIGDLE